MKRRKPNKGSFAAGFDRRRHTFTYEERSRGFCTALHGAAPYHWLIYRVRGHERRREQP